MSDDPATVGQLAPDRTVYLSSASTGRSASSHRAHLNEDCTTLKCEDPVEKQAAVLFDDQAVCRVCRGVVDLDREDEYDVPVLEEHSEAQGITDQHRATTNHNIEYQELHQ